eukprot:gene13025-biopygen8624
MLKDETWKLERCDAVMKRRGLQAEELLCETASDDPCYRCQGSPARGVVTGDLHGATTQPYRTEAEISRVWRGAIQPAQILLQLCASGLMVGSSRLKWDTTVEPAQVRLKRARGRVPTQVLRSSRAQVHAWLKCHGSNAAQVGTGVEWAQVRSAQVGAGSRSESAQLKLSRHPSAPSTCPQAAYMHPLAVCPHIALCPQDPHVTRPAHGRSCHTRARNLHIRGRTLPALSRQCPAKPLPETAHTNNVLRRRVILQTGVPGEGSVWRGISLRNHLRVENAAWSPEPLLPDVLHVVVGLSRRGHGT